MLQDDLAYSEDMIPHGESMFLTIAMFFPGLADLKKIRLDLANSNICFSETKHCHRTHGSHIAKPTLCIKARLLLWH